MTIVIKYITYLSFRMEAPNHFNMNEEITDGSLGHIPVTLIPQQDNVGCQTRKGSSGT